MLLALGAALLWLGAAVAQAEALEPAPQEMPAPEAAAEPAPGGEADTGVEPSAADELAPEPEPGASGDEAFGAEPGSVGGEGEAGLEAGSGDDLAVDPQGATGDAMPASESDESVTVATPPVQDEPGAAPEPELAPNGVRLGPVGYDAEGREGRLHVVVRGDTLWDISEAYLGTPWVWPSVWQENRDIRNPHRIYPDDRIWISDGVMRVVTPEEAAALLAGSPAAPDPAPFDSGVEEGLEPPRAPAPTLAAEPRTQRVSTRETVGFVSAELYEGAASIVDGTSEKVMLSQGDDVYIGLGAGDVVRGDQFTVFRERERVFDPDTGRLLGYHVDKLGWVEVQEPGAEASLGVIRKSDSEIERGDRIVPREEEPVEIAVLPPPRDLEAKISFFAASRTMTAMSDYVYINRGTLDGVDVGSPLEVYRPSYVARESARETRVEVPDRVIAQLLVVEADTNSAVAFVTHTAAELELGDHVRGATR
jgi:hypothetical protein